MPLAALDVPAVAREAELLLAAGEVPHLDAVVVGGRGELEVRGAKAERGRGGGGVTRWAEKKERRAVQWLLPTWGDATHWDPCKSLGGRDSRSQEQKPGGSVGWRVGAHNEHCAQRYVNHPQVGNLSGLPACATVSSSLWRKGNLKAGGACL